MSFRSAATRVFETPELMAIIFENFHPISQFHRDAAHQTERSAQSIPSDCHTLYAILQVCKGWKAHAESVLWRDISSGELEKFLDVKRACASAYSRDVCSMETVNDTVRSACAEGWERFSWGFGPYVRRLYLGEPTHAHFINLLSEDGPLNLPHLQHLQLSVDIDRPEATGIAKKLLSLPYLRSIHFTFCHHGNYCTVPNAYATALETLSRQIVAREQITHLTLDVAPNTSVSYGTAASIKRSFPVLVDLKCSTKMLTPDFVKILGDLTSLKRLRSSGDIPGVEPAFPPKPRKVDLAQWAANLGSFPALSELALYSDLRQTRSYLLNTKCAQALTTLEIVVDENPSREDLADFMECVATRCIELQTLRLRLVANTWSTTHGYTLDKTLLEPLRTLHHLEVLEINPAPATSFTDEDVLEICTFWPKLRALSLMPQLGLPLLSSAPAPSLAALLLLAERLPHLAFLYLPFTARAPPQHTGAPPASLEALVCHTHAPHTAPEQPADAQAADAQWADPPQDDRAWWWGLSYGIMDYAGKIALDEVRDLHCTVTRLRPYAPAFVDVFVKGAEDVRVWRRSGGRLRIAGPGAFTGKLYMPVEGMSDLPRTPGEAEAILRQTGAARLVN